MSKVCFELNDGRKINVELYPNYAPISGENFLDLVKNGFYDGLCFHRVIPGFMIQGGGFIAENGGLKDKKAPRTIKGEFAMNGFKNELAHTRGVISMARSMDPNSAGSQFFIMHKNAPHLDGQYAAFGKVISGIETVDAIAAVRCDFRDKPYEDQVMESVTVETFGEAYDEPEKL